VGGGMLAEKSLVWSMINGGLHVVKRNRIKWSQAGRTALDPSGGPDGIAKANLRTVSECV
jgi:hypothetical protein